MSTRKASKEAVDHILKNILQLEDHDHPITLALQSAKYNDPYSIVSMTDIDIEQLSYKGDEGREAPLLRSHQGLLKTFRDWIRYMHSQGQTVGDNWKYLKATDYNLYRSSSFYPFYPHMKPKAATPTTKTTDTLYDFKKGIKRDASLYPILKSETTWDSWQRGTRATARAQDVAEVLDHTYIPGNTTEAQTLFTEKKKFLFSVFERTLLTDKGKAIVRNHEDDFDAQAVFREICHHANRSTKASLNAARVLTYLTTTHIDDGTWRGTSSSYILHWLEQTCLYNKQVHITDQLNHSLQRTMLENAVHPLPDLWAVKAQADQHKVQTGKTLTFNQYSELLQSAANTYDVQT